MHTCTYYHTICTKSSKDYSLLRLFCIIFLDKKDADEKYLTNYGTYKALGTIQKMQAGKCKKNESVMYIY